MLDVKPWYLSKTIWASLVAVAAAILSAFGIPLGEPMQREIVELILQTITVAASLAAIFGRLVATSEIE